MLSAVIKKISRVKTPTQPVNGHLSGTILVRVSRYEKGKTSLDFTEVRDSEFQWQSAGPYMQVSTSL